MNERFAFAASLGTCIILAYLITSLSGKAKKLKPLSLVLFGLLFLAYSAKSFLRVPAWESELALNTEAVKVSKNSARANSFMATALFNQYKETNERTKKIDLLTQAKPYAIKAVEIHPNYYNGNLMRVGIAAEQYKYDSDLDMLLSEFTEVARYRPDVDFIKTYLEYLSDRVAKNKLLAFYKNLAGNILIDETQKFDWAVAYLNIAMQVDPNDPEIRSLMRKAYTGLGQLDRANQYR